MDWSKRIIAGLIFLCWGVQAVAVDSGSRFDGKATKEAYLSIPYRVWVSSEPSGDFAHEQHRFRRIPVSEVTSQAAKVVEKGLDDIFPFVYRDASADKEDSQLSNAFHLIATLENDLVQMETNVQTFEQNQQKKATYLWMIISFLLVLLIILIFRKHKQDRLKMGEIKRQQDIITKNKKQIESHQEELRKFAYVTSHNLKAPLRGIGHISEWLARDYTNKLDRQGTELFELMQSRVRKIDYLLDDMLTYLKMSSKEILPESVDVKSMVKAIADSISSPKQFKILANKNLPILNAGKLTIYQLLYNLIDNALKYSHKPFIKVEVGMTKLNDQWHLFVKDNGNGIEEKYQHKIFEMFQTLDHEEEIEGSTGIGLAVVKKIVDTWGSDVSLESELDVGTTFYIRIPERMIISSLERKPALTLEEAISIQPTATGRPISIG
ncbi:hypothetical protein FNH22_01000 [Fulvivirga sp. M361]|uniref:sensor histidine kinase n=1 Tax=Fulvivirga sp. M361 TaxID=2594266 RepID=UPI00117A96A1|nr:ATP-binding protein [Fulvivirga sp. M361]TRX62704.1 hypothetical protein FNH22_01000 [Fulvivirga sp. M361]